MSLFTYKGKIIGFGPKNHLSIDIDLGFGLSTIQNLRINGISEYDGALNWMTSAALGREVTVKVVKTEPGYGCEVYFSYNGKEINLSDELINKHLATLFIH